MTDGSYKKKRSLTPRVIAEKKKLRLEELMIRGLESTQEAALILDCTEGVITNWRMQILAKWKEATENDTQEDARRKRIRQFDNIAFMALEEWDRSKRDQKELIITTSKCEKCHGKGVLQGEVMFPEKVKKEVMERDEFKCVLCESEHNLTIQAIIPRWKGGPSAVYNLRVMCNECCKIKAEKLPKAERCQTCCGMGEEEILPGKMQVCVACAGTCLKPDIPLCYACGGTGEDKTTTVRTKQTTGDVAYLNIAKAAFTESAKIEGLYPATRSASVVRNTLSVVSSGVGGQIEQQVESLFITDDVDLLVQSMALLDRLENKTQKKIHKSAVIDKDEPHIYEAERFKGHQPKPETE